MYKNKVPHKDKLKCIICNTTFNTATHRNKHIKNEHNLTYEQYIMKYYFNNIYPTCNCGCGTILKFIKTPFGKWFNNYTTNHFPRNKHTQETKDKIKHNTVKSIQDKFGVDNIMELEQYKNKIKQTKLERYDNENYNNITKIKQTKLERYNNENYNNLEQIKYTNIHKYNAKSYTASEQGKKHLKNIFMTKYNVSCIVNIPGVLDKINQTKLERYGYTTEFNNPEYRLKYNKKHSKIELQVTEQLLYSTGSFVYNNKEFDIKVNNNLYEIDGDYWHPSSLINLTFQQMNNMVNDYNKIQLINRSEYTLYKIHTSKLPKIVSIITEQYLQDNSYFPNYNITNDQPLVTSEYINIYIKNNGIDKFKYNSKFLIRLIDTFLPNLKSNVMILIDELIYSNYVLDFNITKSNLSLFIK